MTFSKPVTQRELDFIRDSWGRLKISEIAAQLGRSERTIYKKINDMHLREGATGKPMQVEPKPEPKRTGTEPLPEGLSSLDRLRRLRDIQWAALQGAEPREMSKLSAEYRETLKDIEAMESGGAGEVSNDDDGISNIIELVRSA